MIDDRKFQLTEVMLQNYIPVPESGCWIWTGSWNGNGYGQMGNKHAKRAAHRVFYAHHIGPIPPGALICHKCDTPICVNPDHLYAGSDASNTRDKVLRGRNFRMSGEDHTLSKLTWAEVNRIRSLKGEKTQRKIAEIFGISKTQVSRIHRRMVWRDDQP